MAEVDSGKPPAVPPKMTENHSDIIKDILNPQNITSIYEPIGEKGIHVYIHDTYNKEPREEYLTGITSFMRLIDIKFAVYDLLGRKDFALPDFTFIGIKSRVNNKEFKTFEYAFTDGIKNDAMYLKNPIEHIKSESLDTRFIESSGARKILTIVNRERVILESNFLNLDLHVFFYDILIKYIPGQRPIAQKDWNGFLYPYFPNLDANVRFPPTNKYTDEQNTRLEGFIKKKQFYTIIDKLLKDESNIKLSLTGVKFLRIHHVKSSNFSGVETVFYNTTVNETRPYMRLLPVENTPISKLHMIKDNPNIEDPYLLIQWSKERNPMPQRNSVFAKIRLKKSSNTYQSLYSTLRLFDDGSADITIQPPKGLSKLKPNEELDDVPKILDDTLNDFTHINKNPTSINGTFVFTLKLKEKSSHITKQSIRDKLPIFSSIIQEIPPLLNQNPLIMLRYKLISNFKTEDKIQTFITQVLNNKMAQGDNSYSDIPELISEEFDISFEEAKKYLSNKLNDMTNIHTTHLKESDTYLAETSSGVDIAIFAEYPRYLFHVYHVNSYITIRRIISFMSVLFNSSVEQLSVPKQSVNIIKLSQKKEEEIQEKSDDEETSENVFENVASENGFESVENTPPKKEDSLGDRNDAMFDSSDLMFDDDAPTLQSEYEQQEDRNSGKPLMDTIPENDDNVDETNSSVFKQKLVEEYKNANVEEPSSRGIPQIDVEYKASETASYFLNKLKETDRLLFDYSKTHPTSQAYTTGCQANIGRQPAVMNEEEYQTMLKEYDDVIKSKEITFYVLPLKKGVEIKEKDTNERYILMKYGSSPKKINYYLCCKFFCIRDNIMVRETEFNGTVLRRPVKMNDGKERNTKEKNTCPFCEGGLITDVNYPKRNETVIERVSKIPDRIQSYVGFLKDPNPNGLYLPCCFLKVKNYTYGDAGFPAEEETRDNIPPSVSKLQSVSYEDVMLQVLSSYIVGSDKFPLDGFMIKNKKPSDPQIALTPLILDKYFSQTSNDLINRTVTPQRLKANTSGFLRIGVDNSISNSRDSFLSAIAPFFGKKSAKDMKTLLIDIIQPRIYASLNYGNLLLEMYRPHNNRPQMTEEIKEWARKHLQVKKVTSSNDEYVLRAYMSYTFFIEWLSSNNTRKELRHFANLFIQPGLFDTNVGHLAETDKPIDDDLHPGIIFIVLDVLKSGELKVRCQPYPINNKMYSTCDIGFLLHHHTGIWEPLFYYDATAPSERKILVHSLRFDSSHKSNWPEIVVKRLEEFKLQCESNTGARGYYTSFSGVSSKKCIRIADLIHELKSATNISMYGIIRDSYNHVAGVVYILDDDEKKLVAVPVIDDGSTPTIFDGKIILDWDDFTPASIIHTTSFYKKYIYPKYQQQYEIIAKVKSRGSHRIEAVKLNNGIFIPIGEDSSSINIPQLEVDEMEWSINRKIIMEDDVDPASLDDSFNINSNEINEAYQHLRITFSNWLNSDSDTGELKDVIDATIFRNDIPLFEKRKRLEIILTPIIEGWLSEMDENKEKTASLLRVDCTLQPESKCHGQCSWKKMNDNSESSCLIHVPKSSSSSASIIHILLLRLVEELLRFGGKRRELFNNTVSKIAMIDSPIRQDDQYIIPEKSSKWIDLLRSDWSQEHTDKPIFMEEISSNNLPQETVPEMGVPQEVNEIFGQNNFKLYVSPTGELQTFLKHLNVEMTPASHSSFTRDEIKTLVLKTKSPVMQFDLRSEPTQVIKLRPMFLSRDANFKVIVFIIRDKSVSILVNDTENPDFIKYNELSDSIKSIINKFSIVTVKTSSTAPQ